MYGLLLGGIEGFCANTHQILALVGWVLMIFKITIPLIIIVIGIIDLGKAAVSSKPEEIKKSVGSLLWRLVGGIAIFFLPLLIMTIFGWATGYNDTATSALGKSKVNGVSGYVNDWEICKKCIVNPGDVYCTNAIGTFDN